MLLFCKEDTHALYPRARRWVPAYGYFLEVPPILFIPHVERKVANLIISDE